MRIALLAVGDELLLGDIVNANAAWLGSRLAAAGHIVTAALVVGDTVGEIEEAVSASYREVGALVVTGGLGPTQDDLTREGLAAAAGVPLVRDEGLVEVLYARYATLGRSFPARNLHQCDLPRGASAIPNPLGSAPGIRLELPGRVVYALPGVPHEMEAMVEASVLPDLAARDPGRGLVVTRTVRTAGMWESAVAEELADLDSRLRAGGSAQLAYLAGRGEVRVRITAYAPDAASAAALVEPA